MNAHTICVDTRVMCDLTGIPLPEGKNRAQVFGGGRNKTVLLLNISLCVKILPLLVGISWHIKLPHQMSAMSTYDDITRMHIALIILLFPAART